jgi:hypothetical protein
VEECGLIVAMFINSRRADGAFHHCEVTKNMEQFGVKWVAFWRLWKGAGLARDAGLSKTVQIFLRKNLCG